MYSSTTARRIEALRWSSTVLFRVPRCGWHSMIPSANEGGEASASHLVVAPQGLLPLDGVVDDRVGVPVPPTELVVPCRPRLVDGRTLDLRQLRHPPPDVVAVGVELLRLRHRVEHPEVRRGVG